MATYLREMPINDLPGNRHYTDTGNPAYVIASDRKRISWIGVIDEDDPRFHEFADAIPDRYRPVGTFAVAGAESQEDSVFWFGPVHVLTDVLSAPSSNSFPALFRAFAEHGIATQGWPEIQPWTGFIPARTWHPGGSGIVAAYPFPGGRAEVVVYEIPGKPVKLSNYGTGDRPGPVPVVTWHCTRCHEEGDASARWQSGGPSDRREACRAARLHIRPGGCRATGPHEQRGSLCAARPVDPEQLMARPSCAEIRQARAAMAVASPANG